MLVHVSFSADDADADVKEFVDLVVSADLEPVHVMTLRRREPHRRWFLGQGKVDDLAEILSGSGADLVIVNHDPAAGQHRNLEMALRCRVVTRTELILHIFSDRARTFEGQLQVELAQLKHAQTRVVRGWSHLDRQKGGVGLRGAGETQLELDQRLLATQVKRLERRLDGVRKRRALNRRARQRRRVPTVALVGYTNAGKSTLFNRLTEARVLAADQLFATLDPTLRAIELPGYGPAILVDTVGFIRDLPVTLVEAFRATLEEVVEADLLLLVVDASHPERDMHVHEVQRTLDDIGAAGVPKILVANKIDRASDGRALGVPLEGFVGVCRVSAMAGDGISPLVDTIADGLGQGLGEFDVLLPADAGKARSWLYGLGAVVSEETRENGSVALRVRVARDTVARLADVHGAVVSGV